MTPDEIRRAAIAEYLEQRGRERLATLLVFLVPLAIALLALPFADSIAAFLGFSW